MAKLMDLWAETGANILDDDTEPTLNIQNSSTGAGLETNRLVASSSATIAKLTINAGILTGNATITALNIRGPSCASGAVMAFTGKALVSCISIVWAASANWGGLKALRIVDELGTFGWIPILPDGVVTGAAI